MVILMGMEEALKAITDLEVSVSLSRAPGLEYCTGELLRFVGSIYGSLP
jgi:hypothetical protein